MKTLLKNCGATYQARIFTALILTGILSVVSGLTLIKSQPANAGNLSPVTTTELNKQNLRIRRLPRSVVNAVLRDLSRRQGIFRQQLQIVDYSQRTWRNGCLELPQPNELCTQALVSGWQVVVTDGRQRWVYHTNQNGRSLRLANDNTPTSNLPTRLPQSISNAVLRDASSRLRQPTNRLNIIQSQERTWKDGCLEIADPNQVCTSVLVPGWRVVVGAVDQSLVYHTNRTGTVIRWNERASEINSSEPNNLKPVRIPNNQLPSPLDRNVVFRQISSGGFAGRTYQTILRNDGLVIRVRIGDANDSKRSIRRISLQQVRQFQQLLENSRFRDFRNLSYPAPNIAADYITYTLTSPQGTLQYNDISQNNLPQNLQVVVRAWNQINN
jgi:hypothetical protein